MPEVNLDPEEWDSTDHGRVFYHDGSDRFDRGEYELAKFVAEHLPGFDVLLTMGPYRGYDIQFEIHPDERVIHLDVYSAGMAVFGSDVSYRPNHPATEYAEELIHDIAVGIKKSDAEFDLKDELEGTDGA